MSEQKVRECILTIIESILQKRENGNGISVDIITDTTNLFEDLGMDSIEIITIIVEVENVFNIEFIDDDMDLDKMIIFGNIVNGVLKALL